MVTRALAILGFFAVAASGAWTRATDGRVDVVTNGSRATAEQAIRRVEFTMSALAHFWPLEPRALTVFVVAGAHDVLPSRQPGHYNYDGLRDYVVVRETSDNLDGVLSHEVTHFWMRQAFGEHPEWLSEGIAEYFSTLRRTPDGFEVGGPIQSHVLALEGRAVSEYADHWARAAAALNSTADWRDLRKLERPKSVARDYPVKRVKADLAEPQFRVEAASEPLVLRDLLLVPRPARALPRPADSLYESAMEARESGDLERHRELLEKAASNPNADPQVLFAWGSLLVRSGEAARATEVLQRAAAGDPRRFAVWETLAVAASMSGQQHVFDKAAAAARAAAQDEADVRRAESLRLLQQRAVNREPRKPAVLDLRTKASLLEGSLVRVECLGEKARIVVKVGSVTQRLLMSGRVEGRDREFACGDTAPMNVRLEYRAREDATYGTIGDVLRMDAR